MGMEGFEPPLSFGRLGYSQVQYCYATHPFCWLELYAPSVSHLENHHDVPYST